MVAQSISIALITLIASTLAASPGLPFVINTWGGDFTAATDAAFLALSRDAAPPLDAVEIGCLTCERNQCDGSVGYGGSPDENCETTLDAMIMDGTTMNLGAVAALRRVRDAISVARHVLEHTTHSMLAGDQATEFALQNGFKAENLTTAGSAEKCRAWKEGNCQPNYRVNVSPDPSASCGPYEPQLGEPSPHSKQASHDTLSLIAIHLDGSMAAGTTTNGASHKIPGRVGDGPIVGSGSYVDGDVGGCGATGDGDVMMRFLPCYQAVENLRRGMSPKEAAEDVVLRMLRKYPDISSGIVVVDKHGEHGAAGSGWTFTYSYRGGSMDKTEVVTVPPVKIKLKWVHVAHEPLSYDKGSDPCLTFFFHPLLLLLLHDVVVGFSEGFQDETVTEELHELPPKVLESASPAVENLLIDIAIYTVRHVKCDNTRPCNRCARNGVECLSEWIRFKHQPPKIRLSTAANATSNEYKFSDDQTWCSLDGELEFVDEGKNLQSIYKTEDAPDEGGESSQDDSEQITPSREIGHHSTPDQQLNSLTLDAGPYLSSYHDSTSETSWPTDTRLLERPSSQQNGSPASGSGVHSLGDALPLPPIDTFSPLPLQESREPYPETHHHAFTETPVYHDISVWPLKDPTEAKLMRYFIEKIARRFDLCDPERHFALVVPWRAAFCPPLLDAALALSARCLSRTTDFDSYISNRYYQRCLNSLISTLGIADALKNQDLFAAVVLLRTLEEIDGPLSGADSQSHLLGGHLFASASASEHSSILWSPGVLREPDRLTSLRRAALLVAFRQEVYMAFACQRPVLPAFYLPDLDRCLDNPTDDGTWTNRILLHLVDTLKFCFGDEPMSPDQAMEKHNELLRYAEEWYAKKPPSFNALFLDENTERQLAPDIWILSDAAATGLLNYHLLRILLLSFDPHTPRVGPSRARFLKQQDRDIKEEVKTCIGLAEGNPECAPHFVLASLGIALAGDRFEERWEKDELMRFLKRAESLHGWSTLAAQRHLAEA